MTISYLKWESYTWNDSLYINRIKTGPRIFQILQCISMAGIGCPAATADTSSFWSNFIQWTPMVLPLVHIFLNMHFHGDCSGQLMISLKSIYSIFNLNN